MTISREAQISLLAAGSYWDIRQDRFTPTKDDSNHAPIPEGWKVLTQFDKSDSGPAAVTGFSARVYQNTATNEIVISYAGTEFGNTSAQGTTADFLNGNGPLALGDYGSQAYRAAALYQEVKATGKTNISFTGHSLGGGLAAIMGVWFNRPAYVYAPAPFEKSVDQTQLTDKTTTVGGGLTVSFAADEVRVLPLVKAELLRKTGVVDPALASYNPITGFSSREQNVSAWAIKGELLEKTLFVLNWIEKSPRTSLYDSSAVTLGFMEKHSIDLHAAALLVPNFETQAKAVTNSLKLLMDDKLYSTNILGSQQHIIMKLLRNETGVRSTDGTVLKASTQMLTHFAADLGKIASNLSGLKRKTGSGLSLSYLA